MNRQAAFYRSPRSPWPLLTFVLALRARSCFSERRTSSLSVIRPFASRRMYRASPLGLINSRLPVPRLAEVFLLGFVFAELDFAIGASEWRKARRTTPLHVRPILSATSPRRERPKRPGP